MNVYQNVNVTGDATVSGKVTAQTLEANALGANAQAVVNSMIRAVFPVGTYLSGPSDPGSYIGGTWEQIKGKFLLASDDVLENGVITTAGTYHVGNTGGSADAVVVNHVHDYNAVYTMGIDSSSSTAFTEGVSIGQGGQVWNGVKKDLMLMAKTPVDGVSGDGKNMPPYVVGYLWKRIA